MEDEIVYFEVKNEKGYQVLGHVDTKLLQEGGDMVKYALIYYDGVETHKIPSYIPNSPMKTSFLTDVENGEFFKLICENRFKNVELKRENYTLKIGDQVLLQSIGDFENYLMQVESENISNEDYEDLEEIYCLYCDKRHSLPCDDFYNFYKMALMSYCNQGEYTLISMSSDDILGVVASAMASAINISSNGREIEIINTLFDGDFKKALYWAKKL